LTNSIYDYSFCHQILPAPEAARGEFLIILPTGRCGQAYSLGKNHQGCGGNWMCRMDHFIKPQALLKCAETVDTNYAGCLKVAAQA
jgi:hypothetical protein